MTEDAYLTQQSEKQRTVQQDKASCLLFMRFQHGSVTYNEDFSITMEGRLYPRDLAVAHETIQRYKENSKHSRELLKKYERAGE